MKCLLVKVLGMLAILLVNGRVDSQCSPESEMYLMESNICYGNNTVFNKADVVDGPESGITCFRRGSTSTASTLWNQYGDNVACDVGAVRCVIGSGFLTIFVLPNFTPKRNGMYTCCIDGVCISTRIFTQSEYFDLFDPPVTPTIDSCSITLPVDVTVAPQQYIVNMITSQVPPTRLHSEIRFTTSHNCTNQDGISCGTPYYLHLGGEMYKYSLPINWNATNSEFTHHQFECGVIFESTQLTTLMTTIRAPDGIPIVDYEVINATAIRIFWNISTHFVNGYIITIKSSSLSTITHEVNDKSVREFVVNGLLPERDYNIEVRGYYDLLGTPGSVTARLEATIIDINGTLLSVTSNTQEIQLNCFTSRVKPSEITWSFQAPRTQFTNDSELLDETSMTYRHYIQVNGTFIAGIQASCRYTVNGQTVTYSLQVPSGPPTNLSVKILSSSSLCINWIPPSGVVEGYIIQYSGIDPQLINGGDTLSDILEGLTQGVIYQFNVFAYSDLPSTESNKVTVLLDIPQISFLTAEPINATSITIKWNITAVSIVDSYAFTYTRTCDGIETTLDIEDSMQTSIDIHNLASGLEYIVSIQPENILGKGTEISVSALLNETRPPETPQLYPPVLLNSTSIRIEWNEVECTQRIARYVIQYSISGGSSPNEVITNAETTSIVITGLSQYSLYSISIAAMNSIGSSLFTFFIFFSHTVDSELTGFSVVVFTTSVQLSWEAIISNNNITYTYEVAFILSTDTECSSTNVNTLPDGYTSYLNTTNTEIEIIELEADTCYIFGVRIYSSYSTVPGDWNIIVERTEDILTTQSSTSSTSTTTCTSEDESYDILPIAGGFVGGVFVSLIIMTVVIVLILCFRKKTKDMKCEKNNEYETVESNDHIHMQTCELHKTTSDNTQEPEYYNLRRPPDGNINFIKTQASEACAVPKISPTEVIYDECDPSINDRYEVLTL